MWWVPGCSQVPYCIAGTVRVFRNKPVLSASRFVYRNAVVEGCMVLSKYFVIFRSYSRQMLGNDLD
jgi:hypothetical protein